MKPYVELLEFSQPNPIRRKGFTRIRDSFAGLSDRASIEYEIEDGTLVHHDIHHAERIMEFSGRWDYGMKNAAKLGEMSKLGDENVSIIKKYMSMKHESMIEMSHATVFIECSRVVSHELVRHRLASFQQESQRFVRYDEEEAEDLFLDTEDPDVMALYEAALALYKKQRESKIAPQIARYVFPNATRTRLVMATNAREWLHILRLRTDKSVQPEMRDVALMIHEQLSDIWPTIMSDVLDSERQVR